MMSRLRLILDELDKKIIKMTKENPDGIKLYEASRKLNVNPITLRARILTLVPDGYVKYEQVRHRFIIYPGDA